MTNELISDQSEENVSQSKRTERNRRGKEEKSDKENKTLTEKNMLISRFLSVSLKVVILFLFLLLIAVIGLMIGFGVIGDENPVDALKWETWQHILDIINGKE